MTLLRIPLSPACVVDVRTDRSCGHGGIVWDASLALAWFIASRPLAGGIDWGASRVLELGAGTGLPAITAAVAHGSRVVVTDKPQLVELLHTNLALNRLAGTGSVAAPLLFGGSLKKLPPHGGPFDVVLASDVLGCADDGAFAPLLKTLSDCFSARGTCVCLMSYRYRAAWEERFFQAATEERGWHVERIAAVHPQQLAPLKAGIRSADATADASAPLSLRLPLECLTAGSSSPVEIFLIRCPPAMHGRLPWCTYGIVIAHRSPKAIVLESFSRGASDEECTFDGNAETQT